MPAAGGRPRGRRARDHGGPVTRACASSAEAPQARRAVLALAVLAMLAVLRGAGPPLLEAQDTIPRVRLGLLYQVGFRPAYALRLTGPDSLAQSVASRVEAIIGRDLDYSDRFERQVPFSPGLVGQRTVDYALWKQLGVDWLLVGEVRREGADFAVELQLYDIVYAKLAQVGRFAVPDPDRRGFRMAVHAISDEVVRWIFNEPGMAASRIAFVRKGSDGNGEIYLVDSDGENLERVTSYGTITLSPAWSPDGTRIAFTSYKDGEPRLYERELATGRERQIAPEVGPNVWTPAYHSNGKEIAFAVSRGTGTEIVRYNLVDRCCPVRITGGGRRDDLSPAFSPDGRRMAFMSNRLGQPHIYVMPADGGEADLVSPYVYGEPGYFTSPDWAPVGDRIAFHGRIANARFHILVAEASGRGMRVVQLTADGSNEDPSWAPDGRHLVFSGQRREGSGLFVVDAVTGAIRPLVTGLVTAVPAWSPSLGTPTRLTLRGAPN